MRGWTRAARCCLVLLACLAQLWLLPAQAARSTVTAARSAVTAASFDAGQSSVPCAVHGTRPSDGNTPAPCPHGDCPFCPCPCCCSHVHAAMGILPQEAARAAYAPPFSTIAAPPVRLGSASRFAVFAGQPRAPPLSI
ncbi:MAG: hypothetical protein ACREDM_03830 [Methylocella sp.]